MNVKKLVILLLLLSGGNILSQNINELPTIEVKGNASIKVVPDIFNWQVNVINDNDDVQEAKEINDRATDKVLALLESINVDKKDIRTSGINITRNNQQDRNIRKYTTTNTIWFVLNNMDRYTEITTKLTNIENVFVNPVTTDYSKAAEVRRQARTDALNAAKDKAEQMAAVYGLSTGKVLKITEGQFGWYPNPFNTVTMVRERDLSNDTYSSGMIDVTAEVTVKFELK